MGNPYLQVYLARDETAALICLKLYTYISYIPPRRPMKFRAILIDSSPVRKVNARALSTRYRHLYVPRC